MFVVAAALLEDAVRAYLLLDVGGGRWSALPWIVLIEFVGHSYMGFVGAGFAAFGTGVLLGGILLWTRRLLPVSVAHVSHNLVVLLFSVLSAG